MQVEAIFITGRGGEPMTRVAEVEAIAGRGLAGDRYLQRTGYWTGVDECQVTLIAAEALEEIGAKTEVSVSEGQHRRNIVTRGVDLQALGRRRFRVGEALLAFDRPRPPCRYIQSVSEHGMTKALGRTRGGICARVIEGGMIHQGDAVEVISEQSESLLSRLLRKAEGG
ncbi:MAG: MOSC domain-containing protein [Actinomycetota bacterium]|nr:MOSC domain-containing protein [Actinomycetota bacterium]